MEKQINITSIFDFSISIHSLDTDKQILSFEVLGDYEGVINATEKDKIIAANDTREIFFSIKLVIWAEIIFWIFESLILSLGNIISNFISLYIELLILNIIFILSVLEYLINVALTI